MAEGAGFGEGNTRSDSLDCLGVNVFTELVSLLEVESDYAVQG